MSKDEVLNINLPFKLEANDMLSNLQDNKLYRYYLGKSEEAWLVFKKNNDKVIAFVWDNLSQSSNYPFLEEDLIDIFPEYLENYQYMVINYNIVETKTVVEFNNLLQDKYKEFMKLDDFEQNDDTFFMFESTILPYEVSVNDILKNRKNLVNSNIERDSNEQIK